MERIIKFRAKSSAYPNAGWLYWTVLENPPIKIIQKSIGQFIGVYDKNNKEIYEGDLVQIDSFFCQDKEREYFKDRYHKIGEICYVNTEFNFFGTELVDAHRDIDGEMCGSDLVLGIAEENMGSDLGFNDRIDSDDLVVVGNSYDNPELAKTYND